MYYILGGAYKALLFVLYLKKSGKDITMITYNKDIIEYCKSEKINYIYFNKINLTVPKIYKIFKLKNILDNIIKKIDKKKDYKFILMGISKRYDAFYLAKELSKKKKGYFKEPDGAWKKYKAPVYKPIFLRGAIIRIALKAIMGLDLIYYRDDEKSPCFGVNEKFLEKHNITEYKPKINVEDAIFETIKTNKINSIGKIDNLIIDQGAVVNVVTFESIKDIFEKILKLPIEISIKKHPKASEKYSKNKEIYYNIFKDCKEVPQFIPVEFIANNIKRNVISLYSTALTTISRLPHINAISLLELVDWIDESYKTEWKKRLKETSEDNILFPKTFEELREILLKK